jgi:hypothetical protein
MICVEEVERSQGDLTESPFRPAPERRNTSLPWTRRPAWRSHGGLQFQRAMPYLWSRIATQDTDPYYRRESAKKEGSLVVLLLLLLVLILAGAGFALHVLWIIAVVFFVFWLIGVALGRGERAGSHKFYKW